MKVLVTGGTGFIGTHLVDLLLAREAEVYVLVQNPEKERTLLQKETRVLRGDLFSIPALPAGLDIVFHLAGKTRSLNSKGYYTVNQEGTASLFRSLVRLTERPKVVVLSSQAAAGPSLGGRPVKETDPPRPVSPYGLSKLRGEKEALKLRNEFPLVIVRSCSVFGPRDRDFLVFFKLAARGLAVTLGGESAASLIYVRDLVEALWLCARTDLSSGEIFNIADSRPYTWDELGTAAAAALGRRCRTVKIPRGPLNILSHLQEVAQRLTQKPGLLSRDKYHDMTEPGWLVDVSKAAEMLSFRTRYRLEQAVQETISWYQAARWMRS